MQMGTQFKSAVLEEQTRHFIKQWHAEVKEKRKKLPANYQSPPHDNSSSTTRSNITSMCNSPLNNDNNDLSLHHRSPTLAQFGSGYVSVTNEITEEEDLHQHVVLPDEPGPEKVQPTENLVLDV